MRKTEYSHLDHEVLIDAHKHGPASKWCVDQFGARWEAMGNRSGRWSMFWAGPDKAKKYRFCFANDRDMVMFSLRWI